MKKMLFLVAMLSLVACGYADGGVLVTPMGSSASDVFIELDLKGFSVVMAGGERSLIVPGNLRGKPVKGEDLVRAIAGFHGLKVTLYGNGAGAVLHPVVGGSVPAINTADDAWRAGWARDIRAIPALVKAAAGDKDPELAWQASRALQRIGWGATLALGGEAAWDLRIAAADRSAYRGRLGFKGTKQRDYLGFLKAAGECGRIGGEKSHKLLAEAIGHWHRSVRGHAVLAASRLPADRASALLNKVLADPSRKVREDAVRAAGRLSALPALKKFVANPSMSTRYCAVDALGVAGGDKATDILESLLTNDPDPAMRRRALSAMTRIGGDRIFKIISGLAAGKTNGRDIRTHAVSCLGRVGREKALGQLGGLLGDGNVNIRFAAVSALASVGPKAIPLLAKAVDDNDDRVCMQAIKSIGMVGGSAAAKLLADALGDDDEYFRAAAAAALGEAGGEVALPILRKALGDSDSLVRAAVVKALGRCGVAGALTLLEKAVSDRDIGVRTDTAIALTNFNATDAKVWALLEKLLADGNGDVCIKAVFTAKALGGPKATGGLKKAMNHSVREVRIAAIEALSFVVLSPDVADVETRIAVITALGENGGSVAFGKIKEALNKAMKARVVGKAKDARRKSARKNARILGAAIGAVVRVGGNKALAVLEEVMKASCRSLLIAAIGELGGCDANRALAALEKSLELKRDRGQHCELEAMSRIQGADRERVMVNLKKYIFKPDVERKLDAWDGARKGRIASARGLSHLGGAGVADILGKAHEELKTTRHKTVNNEIESIINAADLVGVVDVLRTIAIEGVRKNGNHYIESGLTALKVFADYACAKDVPILEEIMSKRFSALGTGSNINYAAVEVLGKMGGPEARDVLIKGLQNKKINSRVKGMIVGTLTSCFPGDPKATKAVKNQTVK